MTLEELQAKMKKEFKEEGWYLWNYVAENEVYTTCGAEVEAFLDKAIETASEAGKQEERERILKILEKGHGGGNWRRLMESI